MSGGHPLCNPPPPPPPPPPPTRHRLTVNARCTPDNSTRGQLYTKWLHIEICTFKLYFTIVQTIHQSAEHDEKPTLKTWHTEKSIRKTRQAEKSKWKTRHQTSAPVPWPVFCSRPQALIILIVSPSSTDHSEVDRGQNLFFYFFRYFFIFWNF